MVYPGSDMVVYRESDNRTDYGGPWKPSIHMPRQACRILLDVTEVRVERLNSISDADALAEGITSVRTPEWDRQHFPAWRQEFDAACQSGTKPPLGPLPSSAFRALWEDTYGPDAWAANPWVWVVEFKRVTGEGV